MIMNLSNSTSTTNTDATHVYIYPHPLLRPYIAHYTYMHEAKIAQQTPLLTLVPDAAGCMVIMVTAQEFTCVFWGSTTECVNVCANQGEIRFRFFIEFLPAGAYAFFHHSQTAYRNERISLDVVHPQLMKRMQDAYEQSSTLQAFVNQLDYLLLNILENEKSCTGLVQKELYKGGNIEEIINDIGYSRRHVQRLFQSEIGCSMKQYQRVWRINKAIKLLQQRIYRISQIAQLCGYYDEAHFIHDFKTVMKVTPHHYIEQMAIFYNELLKY